MKKRKPGMKEYDDLDSLAASWTKKEAAEFNKALAAQRTIDPELWNNAFVVGHVGLFSIHAGA